MDNVFEKIGIYDLIVVLITGLTIVTISNFIDTISIKYGLAAILNTDDMLTLLIVSYFIGMILQEISSLLHKRIIFPKDKLLKNIFKCENSLSYYITKSEIENLKKLMPDEISDEVSIYNLCKLHILQSKHCTRINLDQAIAGLSRSLSLYFFVLVFAGLILIVFKYGLALGLIIALFSALLSILLFFRCVRFTKMRYSYILRAYLYSHL